MKKSKKVNKNFGPMIKLNVPDFNKINQHYETLKKEHNGKKRKGGNTQTMNKQMYDGDYSENVDDDQEYEETRNQRDESPEEEEKKLILGSHKHAKQIENPWIDKAIHEEILEKSKGMPARAVGIKNEKTLNIKSNIIRDQTFIHKHEPSKTDEQTMEALKLLESENEIFTVPDLPPTTFLPRFDLQAYEEEEFIPEILERCKAKPDQVHALSPTYEDYEYVWKPVYVLDYVNKRWKVKDQSTGQIKCVTRLSLLFLDEDPQAFLKRVKDCKLLQQHVNAELMFTSLVDSISPDNVSILSKQRRFNLLKKSMREKTIEIGREKIAERFKHLLRVVEEEYIRQMKKCILLKEMQSTSTHERFASFKIPIRLPSKSAKYLAVVPIPKYDYEGNYQKFSTSHWSKDSSQVSITEKLVIRSLKTLEQRYLNTNRAALKLPKELKDLIIAQNSHHAAVQQNISVQWRDYFVAEIQDDLKNTHHFYESDMDMYKESELNRIVTRFELLLNSYLREFVKQSIDDWVEFIRSFTIPNYDKGELWKISNHQMIIVHLNIHQGKKKKKEEKRQKTMATNGKPDPYEDIPENSIILKPSLEECFDFFKGAFEMVVKATNNVKYLEAELLPFLKDKRQNKESDEEAKEENKIDDDKFEDTAIDPETGEALGPRRGANFKLDSDFTWIREGIEEVERIFNENIIGPTELLNKYKEFEPVLKASKSEKVNSLFEPKQELEVIRNEVEYLNQVYFDILNASNCEVDFPIFRVETKHVKEKLAEQADKIKQAILKATSEYCVKTVDDVLKEYEFMREKMGTDPKNEAILVETREFIKDSPQKVANLERKVQEVGKHLLLLEDYCYAYDEKEGAKYWKTKTWPLEISSDITLGALHIEKQEQMFMERLENEKIEFKKEIKKRQTALEEIKQFK